MSENTQNSESSAKGGMADNLPEELLPVYEWLRTQGQQFLLFALVLLLVALGTVAFLRYRANQASLASAALITTDSVEGYENLEQQYGKTRVGPLIRLGLAKAYFNSGNYQGAREIYEMFLKRHAGHMQADVARLGLAATLEEEQNFADAGKAFEAFAQEKPNHYLYPVAVMGYARCLAAQEQKEAAFEQLDRLMVSKTDTVWEEMARDLRGVIARFEGFTNRSIFDQMDAAAKELPKNQASPTTDVLDVVPDKPAAADAGEAKTVAEATAHAPAEMEADPTEPVAVPAAQD